MYTTESLVRCLVNCHASLFTLVLSGQNLWSALRVATHPGDVAAAAAPDCAPRLSRCRYAPLVYFKSLPWQVA